MANYPSIAERPPARRGRRHLDPAHVLRNWGWYFLVREEAKWDDGSHRSDDALDRLFLNSKSAQSRHNTSKFSGASRLGERRPRAFFQLRSFASSPDDLDRGNGSKGISIFERVHSDDRYAQAKEWFESPLWEILVDPTLTRHYFSKLIQDDLLLRGWFRPTPEEAPHGNWVFEGQEPAFKSEWSDEYGAALRHIAAMRGLKGITLLCALFREAYFDFRLDLAQNIQLALSDAAQRQLSALPLPPHLYRWLYELILDRVVDNVWIAVGDMPSTTTQAVLPAEAKKPKKSRKHSISKDPTAPSRADEMRKFFLWYFSSDSPRRRARSSAYPIVLDSDRLRWFRRNNLKLRKLWLASRVADDFQAYEAIDTEMAKHPDDPERVQLKVGKKGTKYDPDRDQRVRRQMKKLERMPARGAGGTLPEPMEGHEATSS